MNNMFDYLSECDRCLHCAKARCTHGCPVGNDIPEFLRLVRNGEIAKAVELIGHPFGEICGYVCPCEEQCQGSCVLATKGQAVQAGAVERTVFAEHPFPVVRRGASALNKKVAVVGGGVSGIAFACAMYGEGADITIFERKQLLSTLRLIPNFRLPKEAIERVEKQIAGKFEVVSKHVDADMFAELQQRFDVVYLATGATKLYPLDVDGEDFCTPYDDFLRSPHGKEVVVIGGGNTAMDCARLAVRSGASVTVAYRRTFSDMPAFRKEIDCAKREGVKFVFNVAPVCLSGNGEQLSLTLAETVSEGRGKLTITDKTHTVCCDTVVSALGSRFDSDILHGAPASEATQCANVYAGGDATGGKTVAQAVSDGLKNAQKALCRE